MFGFIGAGNMVSAIAKGGFKAGFLTAENTIFTDKTGVRAPQLAATLGGQYEADNQTVVTRSNVVILGVKPNVILQVLTDLQAALATTQPLIISLAAGIKLADLEAAAGPGIPVIRMMPNVNAMVGSSMTAICAGSQATVGHQQLATEFAQTFGQCLNLPETQLPIFTALAGSSPAWIYEIIDHFAMAGVKHGLTKPLATQIITQAVLGSAQLVAQQQENTEQTPSNLIDKVCSPGGTTIAGLLTLRAGGISQAITNAVDTTVDKDQALGKKK